jgi:iron complex outermembrane receptor protein
MKKMMSENIIVIRGISAFDNSKHSPVGFYVDDVSFPIHYMHNPDLFDIERIEILKGPQGTLYGRNTESGVINIITKQPDNELRGKVFGEYGNYDTSHGNIDSYRAGGSINGPLTRDKLYLGLSGQWEDSDGFMKNEYNDDDEAGKIDHINGRGTLRWTPTDRWDISFIADAMDTDDGCGFYRFEIGMAETGRHKIAYDGGYQWEQEGDGQSLRVRYEGDAFNVLSVTGRRYFENKQEGDFDCTPFVSPWSANGIFKDEIETLSEELRVSSPNNSGSFKWLVGLYAFTEDYDIYLEKQKAMWDIRDTKVDTDGYAVFCQGTYTIFGKLHLTAGLRYDHQDLEGEQEYDYMDMMTMTPQSKKYDKDLDYEEWLPKLAIAYDYADDIMVYISVSRGYLVGGYIPNLATSEENFTYDEEETWNYEIGIKTAWLDRRFMANLSAFYIDMEDKQVMEWAPGGGGMMRKITNAAEAHSMGVELELQARPMRRLDLFAGFGYMEAEFDDWTATEMDMTTYQFVTYDYEGKDLPNAPEYTYNLGVQYRHEIGFFGRVDLLGTGKFYGDSKNLAEQANYELVNLRLGYEREHFDIMFWCKNLFDEEYATLKTIWGADEMCVDGDPRMFGATVTYRF